MDISLWAEIDVLSKKLVSRSCISSFQACTAYVKTNPDPAKRKMEVIRKPGSDIAKYHQLKLLYYSTVVKRRNSMRFFRPYVSGGLL